MFSNSGDDDGYFELSKKAWTGVEKTNFFNLVESYEINQWGRYCQSSYRKQRSWIYPVETIWKQNKGAKKQRLQCSGSIRISSFEMTPEYEKDV